MSARSLRPTADPIFETRSILGWLLFTFGAGFVNAGAVVACQSFVTHITGNVTSVAVDGSSAGSFLLVVAMFVVGAITAYLIAETLEEQRAASFAVPIILSFGILLSIALAGKVGVFGAFGSDPRANRGAFTILALLAAALGMVNASVANATKNQIRVTHLTGPATDLAGNVVRALLDTGEGSAVEVRWAALRFAKLTSFAFGAALAVRIAPRIGFDVFIVAAILLLVALGFAAGAVLPDHEDGAAEGQKDEDEDEDEEEAHEAHEAHDRPAPVVVVRYEDGMPPLPDDQDRAK